MAMEDMAGPSMAMSRKLKPESPQFLRVCNKWAVRNVFEMSGDIRFAS